MTHSNESMSESPSSYESTRMMTWVRSPEGFQNALPPVVREILDNTPLTSSNSEAIWAYDQMMTEVIKLHNQGSGNLLSYVYGRYAEAMGLEKDVDFYGKTFITPLDRKELSYTQSSAWNTYLYTAEIPRDVAVEAIRQVTYLSLPSIRYIDDPFVEAMHDRLSAVPYCLAESMLPDITDAEARSLFGQLTTAAEVHAQAAA